MTNKARKSVLFAVFCLGLRSFCRRRSHAARRLARPRIGLVLSGGGARGAAHIGVLKVLEENHVPVDAIAGTSMGAVVGGLYASGLSAADIERVMTSVDWQDAFRDRPARSRPQFPSQARGPEFPGEVSAGPQGRRVPPATRPGAGAETHADPARADAARGADPGLRRSRHPVPRDGHRHRHRRSRDPRSRRPDYRDARQPVGARRVLAGGCRWPHAGGWRAVIEPARRRGARDGRRHPHRGGLRLPAARARQARSPWRPCPTRCWPS